MYKYFLLALIFLASLVYFKGNNKKTLTSKQKKYFYLTLALLFIAEIAVVIWAVVSVK